MRTPAQLGRVLVAPFLLACLLGAQADAAFAAASRQAGTRPCEAAIVANLRRLQERPRDVAAQLALGSAYLRCNQPQLARAAYRQALQADPKSVAARIGLGEAEMFVRRYDAARHWLQSALRLAPENADAAWALGRTEIYARQPRRAQRQLAAAAALHPDDYRLWESLGEAEMMLGRQGEAVVDLRRALQLRPSAARAQRLLLEIQHANLQAQAPRTPASSEPKSRAAFHDYALLLHDGLGNTVLSSPQELSLRHGRWTNRLTGQFLFGSLAGGGAWGASLEDRASVRMTDWLQLGGSGGEARFFTAGLSRPLFQADVGLHPAKGLRLTLGYRQRSFTPTGTALALGLARRGWMAGLGYERGPWQLALDYNQDRVSDGNRDRGGAAKLRRRLWTGPFTVWAGYEWESFSFARRALGEGYFAPKRFLANTALISFEGSKGKWKFDDDLGIGAETYDRLFRLGPPAPRPTFFTARRSSPRGLAILRNSYQLNATFSLEFSYEFFRTALSSGSGAYHAQALLFGLTRRF